MMVRTWLLLFLPALPSQSPAPKDDSATQAGCRSKREQLMEIYSKDAAGYTIYRDASRKERVELQREPVFVWTNPCSGRGTSTGPFSSGPVADGSEVLGTFFSFPEAGQRKLCHEFHSLSLVDARREPLRVESVDSRGSWHRAGADRGRTRTRKLRAATTGPDAPRSHTTSPRRPRTTKRGAGNCACSPSRSTATRAPTLTSSTAPCSPSSLRRGPTPRLSWSSRLASRRPVAARSGTTPSAGSRT